MLSRFYFSEVRSLKSDVRSPMSVEQHADAAVWYVRSWLS